MPVIKYFCTCHGYARGTSRDRSVHRPYSDGYKTTATYEARIRIGGRWLNQQQAAEVARSRGKGRR